jgi:hypothetical protein
MGRASTDLFRRVHRIYWHWMGRFSGPKRMEGLEMSTESGMVLVPHSTLRDWYERAHTSLEQDILSYLDAAPASPPTPEQFDQWRVEFEEAVNCAWHVAGTTLHSREDIRAAIKAIWPLPVRPQRNPKDNCPHCDGYGVKHHD